MLEKNKEKYKEKLTTTNGNSAKLPSIIRVGGVTPHPVRRVWVSALVMISHTLQTCRGRLVR
jgi:hypothetical protein